MLKSTKSSAHQPKLKSRSRESSLRDLPNPFAVSRRSSLVREYAYEAELVSEAVGTLQSRSFRHWGKLLLAKEFHYRSGRTDIVALSSRRRVLAFEAKLNDWRTALHQAHRNRCFAHESYVLLPERVALRVLQHEFEFTRRHVGLCYISEHRFVRAIQPAVHTPWQEWLLESAIRAITRSNIDDF